MLPFLVDFGINFAGISNLKFPWLSTDRETGKFFFYWKPRNFIAFGSETAAAAAAVETSCSAAAAAEKKMITSTKKSLLARV